MRGARRPIPARQEGSDSGAGAAVGWNFCRSPPGKCAAFPRTGAGVGVGVGVRATNAAANLSFSTATGLAVCARTPRARWNSRSAMTATTRSLRLRLMQRRIRRWERSRPGRRKPSTKIAVPCGRHNDVVGSRTEEPRIRQGHSVQKLLGRTVFVVRATIPAAIGPLRASG